MASFDVKVFSGRSLRSHGRARLITSLIFALAFMVLAATAGYQEMVTETVATESAPVISEFMISGLTLEQTLICLF